MKLAFEKWLENQRHIPSLAEEVLQESVVSYKAGAYRGAMMLAFTGLQLILRERISSASEPDGLYPNKWNEVTRAIEADEKWDTYIINNIIPCTEPGKRIFEITDDLINQYSYWKNRRNDAAHSKNNKLDAAHLEAFWLFLQSNLSKLVVKGSQQEIINKIRKYFDLNLTPLNASFSEITTEIPSAIDLNRVEQFLTEIKSITAQTNRDISQRVIFLDALLNIDEIKDAALNFFLQEGNHRILFRIIEQNPARLSLVHTETTFLRRIYREWLFERYERTDFKILISLVRHNIIPEEEKEDTLLKIFQAWHELNRATDNEFLPEGEDLQEFKDLMCSLWKNRILSNILSVDWGNDDTNKALVINFIRLYDLDQELFEALATALNRSYHSWGLSNALGSFFRNPDNLSYKDKLIQIASESEKSIPSQWAILSQTQKPQAADNENNE